MLDPKDAVESEESTEQEEVTETESNEEETSDASEETSTQEKTDDEGEETEDSELESLLEESNNKDKNNVQKRIDKLTAQLRNLEEENRSLKTREAPVKEAVYSESQLKGALKKALDEGDHELAWEIFDYKTKQVEKSLVSRYEEEKRQAIGQYTEVNQEWQKVANDYAEVWSDDKGRELYAGAKRDLDINSEKSLVYQLSAELYHSVDEDGQRKYQGKGSQRQAVADAITVILRRKKLSPVDNDKKKLERRFSKEKRKTALAGIGSTEGESPTSKGRATSDADKLAEYIAERNKARSDRMTK